MDQNLLFDLVKDNSVVGAAGSAALVLLYKIWRIIQADRKEDDHDQAEKEFRNEMRIDIKELRDRLKNCESERDAVMQKMIMQQKNIAEIEARIKICQLSPHRPEVCPILEAIRKGELNNV